jgi:hypothetical protein
MPRSQNGHLQLAGRAADYHPGRRSAPAGPIPSNLPAQAMTDLAKRASLGVRELQSTFQLGLHDAVFGGQIFVPRQQLLVHRPPYVGQDARPIHNGPPAPTLGEVVVDRPKTVPDSLRHRYADPGFSATSVFSPYRIVQISLLSLPILLYRRSMSFESVS